MNKNSFVFQDSYPLHLIKQLTFIGFLSTRSWLFSLSLSLSLSLSSFFLLKRNPPFQILSHSSTYFSLSFFPNMVLFPLQPLIDLCPRREVGEKQTWRVLFSATRVPFPEQIFPTFIRFHGREISKGNSSCFVH